MITVVVQYTGVLRQEAIPVTLTIPVTRPRVCHTAHQTTTMPQLGLSSAPGRVHLVLGLEERLSKQELHSDHCKGPGMRRDSHHLNEGLGSEGVGLGL